MKVNFNELIIGSGGLSGITYLGSLKIIDKYYPIKNFEYLTGCSAGAIICTFINIGYNINEIENLLLELNFSEFIELKISNLINIGGFVDTTKIKNLFKSIFITKNYNIYINFIDLYNETKKCLTINSVNQTLDKVEYFNYINTPNMSIIEALLMSMNVPLICGPIKYNNNIYFDGALLDPYPYNYHKDTIKLGIIVFSDYLKSHILDKDNHTIFKSNDETNFEIFINNIFLIYNNYLKFFYKKKIKNTIYITCKSQYNIEMSIDEKKKLFEIGYHKAELFMKRRFRRLNRLYLLKKYFYLCKFILSSH